MIIILFWGTLMNRTIIAMNNAAFSEAILQSLPFPVSCWNAHGELIHATNSFYATFGTNTHEEFITSTPSFTCPTTNNSSTHIFALDHIAMALQHGIHRFSCKHLIKNELVKIDYELAKIQDHDIVMCYLLDVKKCTDSTHLKYQDYERTRALLDAAPLGILFWNKKLELVECNLEAVKMFHFADKNELIQKLHEQYPPFQPNGEESLSYAEMLMQKAFETGFVKTEWEYIAPDGKPLPSESTLIKITLDSEDLVAEYTRDLREIKETQKRAHEAEERAMVMLDATPLCANFWNAKFENIDCNLAAVKLFELSNKQEYIDRFFELSPKYQPDGRLSSESALEKITQAFEEGYCKFEWMHCKLNGDPIEAEITLIRTMYHDEYIVAGYTKDLREIKQTQKRAREAEERAMVMLDATPLCANFWNAKFENIDCNQAAVNLFDLKNKQEYLDRFFELSPEYQPDGRLSSESALEKITQAFEEGYCKFEWMHCKLNGDPIDAEITLIRTMYQDEFIVAGYTKDLREIKESQKRAREAEERAMVMLDATPLCANFWNAKFENIDCNQAAVKLFELKDKQEYLDRFFELSPEYQPDGRLSSESAIEKITQAFEEGYCKFEWMHRKLNDEPIDAEVTLIRTMYNDEYIVTGYTRDLREIKAFAAQAAEAEERIRTMFDAFPMGANMWDKNFNLVACNDESVRFFELPSKDEYMRRYFDFSPEFQPNGQKSTTLIYEYLAHTFEKGYMHFEWEHLSNYGTPLPTEVFLIKVMVGDEYMVAAYHRDLREIKASIKKIRESEERIQVMLDTFPMGATYWNKDLKIVDCNLNMLHLYGYDSKEAFAAAPLNIFPIYQPDGQASRDVAIEHFNKAFADGYVNAEMMTQNPFTFEPIPMEVSLVRIMHQGEYAVLTYIRDLRELKNTQKKMDAAEARTKAMLDSVPIGANFWDKELNLLDCNMEVVKLYDFENKQDYMENFFKVNPEYQPDGRPSKETVGKLILDSLKSGYERFEWLCINPHTGEHIPVEVTLVRIVHNEEFAIISYVRDLREFKTMLHEIHEAEKDLRAARDSAEQSAKAKSEFLANMSHEIRTPMNGILGLLHLVSQTDLNSVQDSYIQKTLYSANNLLRIINDILDFSKIEAGKLEIEVIPFCLEDIYAELKTLFMPKIDEKNLELIILDEHADNDVIMGDPLRLKQVLFNLVSNAIKFTEYGSITVNINKTKQEDTILHYTFKVIDTGIGLSEEQVHRLFSAFTQADTSVTRKYGGTGLGLVISKRIVEMMQGTIWVESTQGQGSTFSFTAQFQIADAAAIEAHSAQESCGIHHEDTPSLRYGHILLVEDNQINQLIAEELLKSEGFTVEIAENGQEALEKLYDSAFDLVLMDIQMPVMDGLTTTLRIRESELFGHVPVIAMSAHAMSGDKDISLAHGMNDHITKPISPETLFATIDYWLAKSRGELEEN